MQPLLKPIRDPIYDVEKLCIRGRNRGLPFTRNMKGIGFNKSANIQLDISSDRCLQR